MSASSCENDNHLEVRVTLYTDYLVLNPENASVLDLFRHLWSEEGKHFLHHSTGDQSETPDMTTFGHRWLVFVSGVTQKFLSCIKEFMAELGNLIEVWLNLLQSNDGFLNLCYNKIRGKVVRPSTSSEDYRSIIGLLDTRLSLQDQNNIPIEDERRYPQLSVMASKLAYEYPSFVQNTVENQWEMKLLLGLKSFRNAFQEKDSTQAFMCETSLSNLIVVAFRGTEPFNMDDWSTDVDISWLYVPNVGRIHAGFTKALGLQMNGDLPKEIDMSPNKPEFAYYTIRHKLRSSDLKQKFILTGHSLGGALAILFVAFLMIHDEEELLNRLDGVYTFGQPRVGDEEFGCFMEMNLAKYKIKYHRYVYCNDVVPRIPFDNKTMLFKHFGTCFYFDSLYREKILKEADHKNYFSFPWLLLLPANACWELLRGLIYLPGKKGRGFKETWNLTLFRSLGLILPGLTAHCLQDYHNSVYLENSPLRLPFMHQNMEN